MQWLYQLTPCPLCKQNPSTSLACCTSCAQELFSPLITENEIALGIYQGKLEKAIRSLKYHHVTRFGKLFGQALSTQVKQSGWRIDSVTAVPLHWRRYLQRGYNQAKLIATPLAKNLNQTYQPLLTRSKYTKQQAKLAGLEREHNVRNAFISKAVNAKRILLVDDVYTTGATLNACKDALLKAGAASVKTACVAKALKR